MKTPVLQSILRSWDDKERADRVVWLRWELVSNVCNVYTMKMRSSRCYKNRYFVLSTPLHCPHPPS